MDYFVQDGELVSTKRGMQVSKTRHRGTRFVNAVMSTPAHQGSQSKTSFPAAFANASAPQFSSSVPAISGQSLSASVNTAPIGKGSFSVFSISKSPAPTRSVAPHALENALARTTSGRTNSITSPRSSVSSPSGGHAETASPSSNCTASSIVTPEQSETATVPLALISSCRDIAAQYCKPRDETVPVAKKGKAAKKKSDPTPRPARKNATAASKMQIKQYGGFSSFSVSVPLPKKQSSSVQTGRSTTNTFELDQKALSCLLGARKLDNVHGIIPISVFVNPFSYSAESLPVLPMVNSATDNTRFLYQLFEASMPETIFPMEHILTHNPIRSWEFFESVMKDMAKLHMVIVSSVFMEMHCRGLRPSQLLASVSFYLSRMCALVGDGLKEGNKAPTKPRPYVLECIGSMALISLFMNRHDDWHIHMKGLKRLLTSYDDINGKNADWYLIHKLRRSDTMGAFVTGCLPYLEYPRTYPDVSTVIPQHARDELRLSTHECLSAAGILPCVDTSMQNLVVFHKAVMLTKKGPPRSILFDPHSFVDEWFYVVYKLTRYPMSLRDHCSLTQTRAAGVTTPNGQSPSSNSYSLDADTCDLMSPVARVASVLFVYEFIQQIPASPTGHMVALSLLRDQIQMIVNHIKTYALGRAYSASPPKYPPSTPALAPLYMIRPVLIWACIIGYIYLFRFPVTGCDPSFKPNPKRAVFCECIYLLFPDPLDMPTETDSRMSELLDWTTISHSRLPTTLDAFVALMRAEYEAWLAQYMEGENVHDVVLATA
ncbi:hypothetical protein Cpir12675_003188 [Ceratocystis pirilliformis]|uniref:Uncharacterized protein n=1 Tax=Ceratocystis pirilliformis TaxID=259994 RepID=A0ABR3Z5E6_9PEZI